MSKLKDFLKQLPFIGLLFKDCPFNGLAVLNEVSKEYQHATYETISARLLRKKIRDKGITLHNNNGCVDAYYQIVHDDIIEDFARIYRAILRSLGIVYIPGKMDCDEFALFAAGLLKMFGRNVGTAQVNLAIFIANGRFHWTGKKFEYHQSIMILNEHGELRMLAAGRGITFPITDEDKVTVKYI